MNQWMEMLLKAALHALQRILRDALAGITAAEVPAARQQVKDALQRHRRLPGTLRRWLCQEVDRITAGTVEEFRGLLEQQIARLG